MKASRPLAALALALVAVPLAFPFRVVVSNQSYGAVEIPIGPMFIGSNPSDAEILSAFMKKPIHRADQVYNAHKVTSRVDYQLTATAFAAMTLLGCIVAFVLPAFAARKEALRPALPERE